MDKETVFYTMLGELYFKSRILEDRNDELQKEVDDLKSALDVKRVERTEEDE